MTRKSSRVIVHSDSATPALRYCG